jgi:hypothetical protein
MERFWSKVHKGPSCWRWLAGGTLGYGAFRWNGRSSMAHRVSWELVNGPVPAGQVVLQTCGDKLCVKPAHLFLAPLRSSARNPPSDPATRFWAKVRKSKGCWTWEATCGHKFGYGSFHLGGGANHVYAHRFAWVLGNDRPVPKGLCVLHRCDNPKCVRPSHLFLGSRRDNVLDMVQKGRQRNGSTATRRGRV